jgi:photosystem II stability/assembly factor-like uncharacterized protein
MKFKFAVALFIVVVTSCHKENKNGGNTSSLCFEPNFINTQLSDAFISVFFVNGKDGFVGGYNGSIYKTSDSAKTWTLQNSTTTLPIRGIYFLDENNGFAVGGEHSCGGTGCIVPGGFILRTQDGGQTWTTVFTPSDKIEITSIYFINSSVGFCVGDNMLFKTIDGGQTWTGDRFNLGGAMMKVSFADNQNGFVVCMSDKILKTTNGGNTWEITRSNKMMGNYSVSALPGVVYLAGPGKILKSVNNGGTWAELPNSPVDIFDIKFIDKDNGFAFGKGNYSGGDFGYSYGSMYCTNNGGETWKGNGDFKEVRLIQAVSFPTTNIGYAVSGNKIIKIKLN